MLIRHADPERDAAGCLSIYSRYVAGSPVSFEDSPPSVEEFAARIGRLSQTHAFLVADDDGRTAGYVYAGTHRERPAYRWATETSVYIDPDYRRRGLGRALYEPLLELIGGQGYRIALAGITIPNPGSIGLHRALGFEEVGVYRRIGWKAGAWQNVIWMAKQLGPDTFETEPPPSPGPPLRLSTPIELR